jgi:hypothetical protein
VFAGVQGLNGPAWLAFALAVCGGVALSWPAGTPWRRVFVALGFPLSLAASGWASTLPTSLWLLPLGLLWLAYPLRAWRDAPLFPTPAGALKDLGATVVLPSGAQVLDAGCGLGAGLRELRHQYPSARLHGMEWSWPLRWLCALRCRFARVRRSDMWAASWAPFDLVYIFQRPESLPRAWAKAQAELRPGAWLASLEFAAFDTTATHTLHCADGRPLWLYQMPAHSTPRSMD